MKSFSKTYTEFRRIALGMLAIAADIGKTADWHYLFLLWPRSLYPGKQTAAIRENRQAEYAAYPLELHRFVPLFNTYSTLILVNFESSSL